MPYDAPDATDDLAECRRLLGDGSRSFHAASRILPREVAQAATALYAFCRLADDRVDVDRQGGALADLDRRLCAIYAGAPLAFAGDRAFAAVVQRYRIPEAWPRALLEGFAWDAQGRQYEDLGPLRAYAARVAGSVGAMMARLMGVHSRAALARACELGVAMQLTNIARDVGDDARLGRLYLPRAWMREAGIDPDGWLARPAYSPALGSVVRRVLEEARRHYAGAHAGITSLPPACRPGIRAAALLYAEIGRAVEQRGFDSFSARAHVGAARKLQLVSRATLGMALGSALGSAFGNPGSGIEAARGGPPPEIDFLLDAPGALAGTGERLERPPAVHAVLELFDRLERRDRGAARAVDTGMGARA